MLELTDATIDRAFEGERPVLVYFWAPWCGPCRVVRPTLDEVAHHFDRRIVFAQINVDDAPDTTNRFDIYTIPCFLLFLKGRLQLRFVGPQGRIDLARRLYPVSE